MTSVVPVAGKDVVFYRMNIQEDAEKKLLRLAYRSGASSAALISVKDISVEDHLADLCREPKCPDYGLSQRCPPHISGPSGFRQYAQKISCALVVRIDVPSYVMFSDEGTDVMRLLHEMVAGIERAAIASGFPQSKAFAGGSCKRIFCREHKYCRVLSGKGECRHPESARASMSGFGINVKGLMRAAGWPTGAGNNSEESGKEPMTWLAGLIMIG
jgi:predicted metal-binding protein